MNWKTFLNELQARDKIDCEITSLTKSEMIVIPVRMGVEPYSTGFSALHGTKALLDSDAIYKYICFRESPVVKKLNNYSVLLADKVTKVPWNSKQFL